MRSEIGLTINTVTFIKFIICLIASAALGLAGLLIPAHLRSVEPAVLSAVALNGDSNEAKIAESLKAAHTGPAQWITLATSTEDANPTSKSVATSATPYLAISGGPDRDFEEFLKLLSKKRLQSLTENHPVISILLPRSERATLANSLSISNDRNVATLLQIRNLKGLTRLHPAEHAAGAPFDTAILTMALLIDGGHLDPKFGSRIGELALDAQSGNKTSITAIEELATATLTLGRRLDYRSLANLASFSDSPEMWADMATLFRAYPEQVPQLYTALHYEESSSRVFDYLKQHSSTGIEDLSRSIEISPESLSHLLELSLPIHTPNSIYKSIVEPISHLRPDTVNALAANNRSFALTAKVSIFLIAGLLLALAISHLWRGIKKPQREQISAAPSILARNLLLGGVFAICLWIAFEPEVLKAQDPNLESSPRIEIQFAVAGALESLQSPVKVMPELNQATLLVLALFFVIQLVIYCLCLIKIQEIAKQAHDAATKLKLLDNEENLFDLGLYIGLGGTVLSLILVAVGVVEASLMAAYASTLFGILFVAILKVLHLRPYRRKLILEAEK